MPALRCLLVALAMVAPAAASPPTTASPRAELRALPLAERCAIAQTLATQAMHYAVRTRRMDAFFVDHRAQFVAFLHPSDTSEANKLIASTETCAPVQKTLVAQRDGVVWTTTIAGVERRGEKNSFVLFLNDDVAADGPRFHFSWATIEPYAGNDRPPGPGVHMETGKPLILWSAPELHVYIENTPFGVNVRTLLALGAADNALLPVATPTTTPAP
jgi:hypothetical protein